MPYPVGETFECSRTPIPEIAEQPFYQYVPKDLEENLRWRLYVLERCGYDANFREAMIMACQLDTLFFLNTFCWLYEPRPMEGVPDTWIPWITWTSQDNAIVTIEKYIGKREIGFEKSRAQGVTWLIVFLFLKMWGLSPSTVAFGLVSKTEDAVANDDDPDSLFWKIDNEIKWLPTWMFPWYDSDRDRSISKNSITNPITKSTIVGVAATKAAFVGGRKTAVLWDEFAEFPENAAEDALRGTQFVTDNRMIVSTPESDQDTFYRIMHSPSSMLKMRMHWSENPVHGAGLYRVDKDGNVTELDPTYDYTGYKFETNPSVGAFLRSPWYDAQCVRPGATSQTIAKELDIDYGSASYKFFGDIARKCVALCKPPLHRGEIHFLRQTYDSKGGNGTWVSIPDRGPFKLWCELENGHPPMSRYVVACDVAAGSGSDYSSNSVIVILDRNTGEQVGEWADHRTLPEELAYLAVGVCCWLSGGGSPSATLNWDVKGGPGSQFTRAMTEDIRYPYMYRRGEESQKKIGGKIITNVPGWYNKNPEATMGDLRDAMHHGAITIYSEELLHECNGWEKEKGKLVYTPSKRTTDEASYGESHGDRVTAMAIAYQTMKGESPFRKQDKPFEIPGPGWLKEGVLGHTGCLAWREQQYELALLDEEDPYRWDDAA